MAVRGAPNLIVDTEAERSTAWPEGTHVFCRDTNNSYVLRDGAFSSRGGGGGVSDSDPRLTDARTPLAHSHPQSEVTSLVADLAAKEPANANIQAHVVSAHAPSTAQKNSDILQAEIEAKLTGVISSHSHAGGAGGDVVYVPTTADTAINVVADATIVTRDVTGVAAGDQVIVEAWFTILNNSTATRVYVITLDFDGLFDIEISTGACAFSATLMHMFRVDAVFNVRSTSLSYAMVHVLGQLAAGIASGGDTAIAATHLHGMGWGTSASNATGTLTVALKVRSANATATQTLRLHTFTIRKVTPT